MPRFTIVTHDWPVWHWDFFLEAGDVLSSWRLYAQPTPGVPIRCEATPPHRLEYLTYTGPVSGGRGTVGAWDTGTFEWLPSEPGVCRVSLTGHRHSGRVAITATTWQLEVAEQNL